ncbi:lipase [Rhizobium sp. Leaf371]|uniref:alpha/beta hydrolase n=1 Tax=Rhizobium sp. Leaf371 TaxID=1736355 RepID=UPI0007148AC4|nr:alpha/beta hydrolase [Rhizobium sp. Leaf371]KQS71624.1 lipase [Rhizobium sp. Leaf371]
MTALDLSARRVLDLMARENAPPIETLSPEEARTGFLEGFAALQKPLEEVAATEERFLGPLRLRLWRGQGAPAEGAPALLYLHGGGWVVGAPESHEDICRILANLAGAVVVSPDYRLAPDHPYPAAVEDCAALLADMAAHADRYGIDPARIAVGGDSAGGNLAAVLALMARDGALPQVTAQILIYPVTDQRQTSASYAAYARDFGLTAAGMAWFRAHYLPREDDGTDWRLSPLLVSSLEDVAPAFVALAGHDVLYDEGAAYAERLQMEAEAIVRTWPGQIHGFVSMGGLIPEARDALEAAAEAWAAFDAKIGRARR